MAEEICPASGAPGAGAETASVLRPNQTPARLALLPRAFAPARAQGGDSLQLAPPSAQEVKHARRNVSLAARRVEIPLRLRRARGGNYNARLFNRARR